MKRKSNINKLSIAILSGLISVSTLSVSPNAYAHLEVIDVVPHNDDIIVKIKEKNEKTAVVEVSAKRNVSHIVITLSVDYQKTITKHIDHLNSGKLYAFEIDLTAEKTKLLPKTASFRKQENFKVKLKSNTILGSIAYSVADDTAPNKTNSVENTQKQDTSNHFLDNKKESDKDKDVSQQTNDNENSKPTDNTLIETDEKDEVVVFEDDNLKTVLLNLFKNYTGYDGLGDTIEGEYEFKLKNPDYKIKEDATELTKKDLEQIEALALRGFTLDEDFNPIYYEFKSIKGLEYAINLKQLTINSGFIPENNPDNEALAEDFRQGIEYSKHSFSDVSSLKNLKHLEILRLSHNNIEDISPLKDLSNLRELYISHNRIADISSLKNLVNLEKFDISKNEVSDLGVVAHYTKLNLLDLVRNKVSDFSPAENLNQLAYLNADNNQITSVNLSKLVNLQHLHLSKNKLSSVSSLNTTLLESLDLSHNNLDDTSLNTENIKANTQLENLNISHNQISDISFLENASHLKQLFADNNHITDISKLAKLTNLEWLYLNNNKVTHIESLKDLTNLNRLRIENNEIADITGLENLSSLTELHIAGNKIKDLSVLDKLSGLYDTTTDNQRIEETFAIKKEYEDFYKKAIGLKPKTEAFNQHILTKADMLKIINFEKYSGDITADLIAPLKYADNLETFVVALSDGNRLVTDLSFIANKPKLKQFAYINNSNPNEKIDLTLGKFVSHNLEDFRVSHTNLSNLDFLADNNLKTLVVNESNLSSLADILHMTNLERLEVSHNHLTTLEDLSHLTHLNTLYLKGNNITDISKLEGNQNLRALIIDHIKVSDISVLEKLKNLQRLHIDGNNLDENYMTIVKNLKAANTLGLGDISLADFEWLKTFAIRDEILLDNSDSVEDAGENEARSINFKNLNITVDVSSDSIVDNQLTIANPLKDWDNQPLVQDMTNAQHNSNLSFMDDKIKISLVDNQTTYAYPISMENEQYAFGKYQMPPLISGTVTLNLNKIE